MNVAGLINMGLDQVLSDLESEKYTVQTFNIPACAINAPHRRDRVWIIANSESAGAGKDNRGLRARVSRNDRRQRADTKNEASEIMAHTHSRGQSGQRKPGKSLSPKAVKHRETIKPIDGCFSNQWTVEPSMGRVANGVPKRVDRLKQLGNAVVPQVVEVLGRAIMEVDLNLKNKK